MLNLLIVSLPHAEHLLTVNEHVSMDDMFICIICVILGLLALFVSRAKWKYANGGKGINWVLLLSMLFFIGFLGSDFCSSSIKAGNAEACRTVIHYHQLKGIEAKHSSINLLGTSKLDSHYRKLEHQYHSESNGHYVTKSTRHIHYAIGGMWLKPQWWQYL